MTSTSSNVVVDCAVVVVVVDFAVVDSVVVVGFGGFEVMNFDCGNFIYVFFI